MLSAIILLSVSLSLAQAAPGPDPGRPDLREIDSAELLELVRRAEADAVLVNVWATWCVPCREEIPLLLSLRREWSARGFELVLVSADFPSDVDAVREFLVQHGVDFTTYLKVGDYAEFVETLEPRWCGALPASFVFDAKGRLRRFWEGPATADRLRENLTELLGPPRAR